MKNSVFVVNREVREALEEKKPVVALESTIISHGMPFPQNLETALEVEQVVRAHGAIPATIAMINGKIHVGCSASELEEIAKADAVLKLSIRDLALAQVQNAHGGTTVAATMHIASMAGIRCFATGGIGGVHRGVEKHGDVSADLDALSRYGMVVVCAGIKAILDIPRTLEMLESLSIPVICFRDDEFPAFFMRASGQKSPQRLDSPEEFALVRKSMDDLRLIQSILVTNPIAKAKALDQDLGENAIAKALKEAEEQGISGKEQTPFLLKRTNELTGGESLRSNIELIKANAALCADIAVQLYR